MSQTATANLLEQSALGRLPTLPKADFQEAVTPLEHLDNLAGTLGSRALFVKRDDCASLAFGGNKVRQLEYYFGEAVAQSCDTILITGAVQSNFCRLAAAASRKLGMECHIQMEERVPKVDPLYRQSGNVLIEKLLGAHLHSYPAGEDEAGSDANMERLADQLRSEGRNPYVIHLGPGHPPLGALGYVDAARELLDQLADRQIGIDEVVVASGSGNTHAGTLFGLRALGSAIPVTGICVRRSADLQRPRIEDRCQRIAEYLEIANPVADDAIVLDDQFLAPGYGQLNPDTEQAILMAARTEALIVDPVYTGKAFAGFIHRARQNPERSILFIHTGGTPGIFAYANSLNAILE